MKDFYDCRDSCLSGQTIRQTVIRAQTWVQAHFWEYEEDEFDRLRFCFQNRQKSILLAELVQLFFENSDHTADSYCLCLQQAIELFLQEGI